MENAKKFYEALAKDEGMRKRADALNEKYAGKQPGEAEAAADIVAFAKAEGFDFTAEDLKAYVEQQSGPIADDELDAVVGGAYKSDSCLCILGGGGKDQETGNVCACIAAGAGKHDLTGNGLICALHGFIPS